MSENAITAALRSLGYDGERLTGHGFRAMARTLLDVPAHLIEHQRAHVVRDPLGRAYNRTHHLAERRAMMRRWSDYLDALRAGPNRGAVQAAGVIRTGLSAPPVRALLSCYTMSSLEWPRNTEKKKECRNHHHPEPTQRFGSATPWK